MSSSSSSAYATSSLVVGYALCSSLLAVINKFAITYFNYPRPPHRPPVPNLHRRRLPPREARFPPPRRLHLGHRQEVPPAALVFYLAIFTNTNLLRHANVDTHRLRSLTPLLVAIADTVFRSQPRPSNSRSCLY
ncbi:GDP-mannose transporter GONST4 [Raphanus sativus]|nr:GDP-mannose transporter GONST4 [Raphanus sativus]